MKRSVPVGRECWSSQRVAQWLESLPARERQILAVVEAGRMKLTQHEEFRLTASSE